MAQRTKTEYPDPYPGLVPGFVESLTDKQIDTRDGKSDVVQWDWTYYGSDPRKKDISKQEICSANDLTSIIFSDKSKAGKRVRAIMQVEALPDNFDDGDLVGVPVWITWGSGDESGKVVSISPMSEMDLQRYPDLHKLLNPGSDNASSNANDPNNGEEDFEQIPF